MTDRNRFRLVGPVKLCELHRSWYSRACGPDACETEERSDVTVAEFRSDGSLQRHWGKNPPPNSSEWTSYYEYKDGRLSAMRIEQTGTSVTNLYEYDSARRLSRLMMIEKDGKQRVAETYSYEADGRKKKTVHVDPELHSGSCGVMFAVDGTDAGYAAPGTMSITSIYDEHDRPIEHLFHDGCGELVARIDFRYDLRGNLVEEVCTQEKLSPEMVAQFSLEQLEAFRLLFVVRRHHRYDEQDRKIEISQSMAPNDFDRQTFAYNDHGDVILEILESSHAEYSLGEDGELAPKPDGTHLRRSETRLRYQYDSRGNWIEKIVETPGGPTWSIERRTISYFD